MRYNDICAQVIGCNNFSSQTTAGGNLAITGATSPVGYPALGFTAPETGTLMKASFYFSASGNNTTISLYADDGTGKPVATGAIANSEGPSTAITSSTTIARELAFGPGSAGIAVTAGTRYHAVIKSYTSGQNPSVQYTTASTLLPSSFISLAAAHSWSTCLSATTADTWGAVTSGRIGGFYTMSSGNTFGAVFFTAGSASPANATMEYGSLFVSPPLWFSCDALSLALYKAGAPTGDVTLKLYVNGALAAQSGVFQAAMFTTSSGNVIMPIPVTAIPPNSICRIVWSATTAGTLSTNYLRSLTITTMTNANTNTPLSAKLTSNPNGAGWVDTAGSFVPFWLCGSFQQGPEFMPAPLDRRQFNSLR